MQHDYYYGTEADQFSFYRIPKVLFTDSEYRKLSTNAKTLYGILLDRMNLSVKNGWLDEKGRVYIICTIKEIKSSMGCAEQKAVKLLNELEYDAGLITRKRQGMGKPNVIYVKNFISADTAVSGRLSARPGKGKADRSKPASRSSPPTTV